MLKYVLEVVVLVSVRAKVLLQRLIKTMHVPDDEKRPFEIVNGNRFGVLCQSLLEIAYDSSLVESKQVILFLIQQQYHGRVEGM